MKYEIFIGDIKVSNRERVIRKREIFFLLNVNLKFIYDKNNKEEPSITP